jgi:hypothetical protein
MESAESPAAFEIHDKRIKANTFHRTEGGGRIPHLSDKGKGQMEIGGMGKVSRQRLFPKLGLTGNHRFFKRFIKKNCRKQSHCNTSFVTECDIQIVYKNSVPQGIEIERSFLFLR